MEKIPLMAGCGVMPMGQCGCDCVDVRLTKEQDIDDRATYDPATGVLNLPPAIVGRRQQTALGIFLPPNVWLPVVGLAQLVVDTTGGVMVPLTPDDRLVMPRNGYFNLAVHVQAVGESDGVLFVRLVVVGVGGFTRATSAPVVAGVGGGVNVDAPASPRTAGDIVRVEVMTTCPTGVTVETVSVAGEYVEGT